MEEKSLRKNKIHLRFPSDDAYPSLIRKIIVEIAEMTGFPEDEIAKMEMAVDEAWSNVIEHSYSDKEYAELKKCYQFRRADDVDRPIDLRIEICSEKVVVTIINRGKKFDFNSYQPPSLEEYLAAMKPRGLGIYIIKTFMDEVKYDYKPGVGNILTMTKYLPQKKH